MTDHTAAWQTLLPTLIQKADRAPRSMKSSEASIAFCQSRTNVTSKDLADYLGWTRNSAAKILATLHRKKLLTRTAVKTRAGSEWNYNLANHDSK